MMDLKAIKTAIVAFVLIAPMSVLAGEEQADKKIPSEYRTTENPFTGSDKSVFERGEFIYSKKCVKCHGEKGNGVGGILETSGIPIPPFNEGYFSERKDGYIFRIVEQGIPDTLMAPFGPGSDDNLSADDIWKVISFMRERFGK